MIEITEHDDYNKPANNNTIVEVNTPNNQKNKLFKVFNGIWLSPDTPMNIPEINLPSGIAIPPYKEIVNQTVYQKSKYLEQMTILFKRINTTALGQNLLDNLSKGAPVNFNQSNLWSGYNMIVDIKSNNELNRKFVASCIIQPSKGFLATSAMTSSHFKIGNINTEKAFLLFNPDCIYSIKDNHTLNYFDPAVALYHELLHVSHSLYHVSGSNRQEEEFITFGHKDATKYLDTNTRLYSHKQGVVLENLKLIKEKVHSIQDPIDKQYFQEKYGFTEDTVIDQAFVDNYIQKHQFTHSEYSFVKELNLQSVNRKTYMEKMFIPFKYDISNTSVYTIEGGFVTPSNTIKQIKRNPYNILAEGGIKEINIILSQCNAKRPKRSVEFEIIPLEPLGEDIDSGIEEDISKEPTNEVHAHRHHHGEDGYHRGQSRTTREVSGCQGEIADILENLHTVYEKSKEIPGKLIGIHAKATVMNIPEETEFHKLQENVFKIESEPIKELETFKVGDLVGFDRITPKDIFNAHRINHDLTEGIDPIHFTNNDIGMALEAGNITYTNNKAVNTKMNVMYSGKGVLKAGNAIANIAQFGIWVDEILEDFKGETGKDNLHIANDVLSIVPYLGQVINTAVDIKDGNYVEAIETLGILILLEVFPELMLPVFLIGLIVNAIQKNKQQKEMVSKAVWNILMEREQLLDSSLETNSKNLAHICVERIQKIADNIEQQLTFSAQSILNNIKYYGKKHIKQSQEATILEKIVSNASNKLFKTIEEKRKKAIEALFKSLKKTIVEDFKVKAKGEINQFNEQTKTIIKDMLKEHSKDISSQMINEALNIAEHSIKPQDIDKTIKHELDILVSMLEAGVKIILHETGVPLPYNHIALNENNKVINKLTNKELLNQNAIYDWGRHGNAIKLEAGHSFTIDDHLFKDLTITNSFTISFWIKVPLTKNYDQETPKDISIIKNSFNSNGWAFILNGKYLHFAIGTKSKKTIILLLGNYFITNNVWTKITVINNLKKRRISLFINDNICNALSTSWISKRMIELGQKITIGVPEQNKDTIFMLDDLKIYTTALTPPQVNTSYINDKNPELLYDYFGSCLRDNRLYILAVYNYQTGCLQPINQLEEQSYWVYYNNNRQSLGDYNFKIQLTPIHNNLSETNNRVPGFIHNNDHIYIVPYNNQDGSSNALEKPLKCGLKNTERAKVYTITINSKEHPIKGNHIYHLDKVSKDFDSFKIFTMQNSSEYNYGYNNNIVSLIASGEGILNRLVINYNKEILALDGVITSKNFINNKVFFPFNDASNNQSIYAKHTLFYLVPADEVQYYINLLKSS